MLAERASPIAVVRHRGMRIAHLDPRFFVEVHAGPKGTTYRLTPKEDVRFKISFNKLDAERRRQLLSGARVPLASGEVVFHDLPILQHYAEDIATLQIARVVPCIARVEIERDGVRAELLNVPATMHIGLAGMTVHAAYTNAPLDIEVQIGAPDRDGDSRVFANVQQTIDARWLGQPINDLPHFDRIWSFAKVASETFELHVSLVVPGVDETLEVPWILIDEKKTSLYDKAMADLNLAREVATLAGVKPNLPRDVADLSFSDVPLLHALLTAGEFEGNGDASFFTGTLDVWSGYTERLAEAGARPIDFEADMGGREFPWTLLDTEVRVFMVGMTLSQARCTVERLGDGRVSVTARGTPASRFWARRGTYSLRYVTTYVDGKHEVAREPRTAMRTMKRTTPCEEDYPDVALPPLFRALRSYAMTKRFLDVRFQGVPEGNPAFFFVTEPEEAERDPWVRVRTARGCGNVGDDVEATSYLAHELGHHEAWLRRETSEEYEEIMTYNDDPIGRLADLPPTFADEILVDEPRAWRYGREILARELPSFDAFERFDEIAARKIREYVDGVTAVRAKGRATQGR